MIEEFVVYNTVNVRESVVELQTLADVCGVPIKLPLGLNEVDEKLEFPVLNCPL